MKATFTDEMARERLAYLRRRTTRPEGVPYPKPKALTICSKNGPSCACTRRSIPGKSPCWNRPRMVTRRPSTVIYQVPAGRARAPLATRKVVTCPDADFGTLVGRGVPFYSRRVDACITSLPHTGRAEGGACARPGGTRRRAAASTAPRRRGAQEQTAILEDDVVALPVACGEMAFRGDAPEPIIKHGVHMRPFLCRRHAIDASADGVCSTPCR